MCVFFSAVLGSFESCFIGCFSTVSWVKLCFKDCLEVIYFMGLFEANPVVV